MRGAATIAATSTVIGHIGDGVGSRRYSFGVTAKPAASNRP
jgi:hypothetical protein